MLEELLKEVQILAVVCNQYGDTGKGKFSDFFAAVWADVIARGTGGNNAGHTVVINGKERIFHLIPAGITYDKDGKINILGNGMVIDPGVLVQELNELDAERISYNNLMISKDANLILPFHVARDAAKDKSQKGGGIGTTGRGIGPCYTDKIARRGITISDLYDKDRLERKLKKLKEFYPEQNLDIDRIIGELSTSALRIRPFVKDTVAEMHEFIRNKKKVSLEGAQGLLLSVEHGPSPYITSSDCSVNGTASGVGISAKAIDLVLGIFKFPFMTRVGGGPFTTELGGRKSEDYCAENYDNGSPVHSKEAELKEFGIPFEKSEGKIKYDRNHPDILKLMNSKDEFEQGIGIRLAAGEYGATTARPRRVGWTDAVAARYAVGINGPMKLVLTKADCLTGLDEFKIARGYEDYEGNSMPFIKDAEILRNARPVYATYQGWKSSIAGEKSYDRLPECLRKSVYDFENFVGAPVAVISTGSDQKDTIIR